MKLETVEDLRRALADALRPSDCPCATPLDRSTTILEVRKIYNALSGVKSLPELKGG